MDIKYIMLVIISYHLICIVNYRTLFVPMGEQTDKNVLLKEPSLLWGYDENELHDYFDSLSIFQPKKKKTRQSIEYKQTYEIIFIGKRR